MKKLYLLFLVFTVFSFAKAQNPIPNPGFETGWYPANYPNGWSDSRDISQISPGVGIAGNAAQGYKTANTFPAFITSSNDDGIAISTAYTFFSLYYRFTGVSGDVLNISVSIYNASNVLIASGFHQVTANTSLVNYTPLSIPINYTGSGATEAIISIYANTSTGGSVPNVGTKFDIDDLLLSNSPLAIENINRDAVSLRVFPNPATNYIQIEAEGLKGNTAGVQIADMTGRIVKEISGLDFSIGNLTLQLGDLPAGNYSVAIKNDEMMQTKKLVIR